MREAVEFCRVNSAVRSFVGLMRILFFGVCHLLLLSLFGECFVLT